MPGERGDPPGTSFAVVEPRRRTAWRVRTRQPAPARAHARTRTHRHARTQTRTHARTPRTRGSCAGGGRGVWGGAAGANSSRGFQRTRCLSQWQRVGGAGTHQSRPRPCRGRSAAERAPTSAALGAGGCPARTVVSAGSRAGTGVQETTPVCLGPCDWVSGRACPLARSRPSAGGRRASPARTREDPAQRPRSGTRSP